MKMAAAQLHRQSNGVTVLAVLPRQLLFLPSCIAELRRQQPGTQLHCQAQA
jgi:hypothetical protein